MSGKFKEGKSIELLDDDENAYARFTEWAYCGCIAEDPRTASGAWEDAVVYLKTTLYPAYLLAVKLLLADFENVVMDRIQAVHYYHEGRPDKDDIKNIFEQTPSNNKLRLYCAALIAWSICNEHFRGAGRRINKDKLIEHASLSRDIDDFALELVLFQGNYGGIFYEVPRREPRSPYNLGEGDGFPEGLGSTFFHNPGYEGDSKLVGKAPARGTPRQDASHGGSGGLVTGVPQGTAGLSFTGNAGAPRGSAIGGNARQGFGGMTAGVYHPVGGPSGASFAGNAGVPSGSIMASNAAAEGSAANPTGNKNNNN